MVVIPQPGIHFQHKNRDITFGQGWPHLPLLTCNMAFPASVSSQWSPHQLLCLSLPAFRIALTFWTAGHALLFPSGSGGMASGLKAFWTAVMKDTDSELPTTGCVSPADNLQLSGNRPVLCSGAASHGRGLWWHSLLNIGFGNAQKDCDSGKKNREGVVINHCPHIQSPVFLTAMSVTMVHDKNGSPNGQQLLSTRFLSRRYAFVC